MKTAPGHVELQGCCVLRALGALTTAKHPAGRQNIHSILSCGFQMRCKTEPWPFIVIKDPMTIPARVEMLTNMSWPISNLDRINFLNSPCSFNWISFSSFLFPKPLLHNVSSPEWLLDPTPEVCELSVLGNPYIHFVYITQRKRSVRQSNTLTSRWGVFNFPNEKSHWCR